MLRSGTDEAGYGPLLGPLVVVTVAVEVEPAQVARFGDALRLRGVIDSKRLHTPGSIAALESVALPAIAWLTGRMPAKASDLAAGDPAHEPWLAVDLPLPLAASIQPWSALPATPLWMQAHLLEARHLNAAADAGINRSDAEWEAVASGLARAHTQAAGGPAQLACDRLGGRQRYGGRLGEALGIPATVVEESPQTAAYTCGSSEVRFLVGGESREPLIALASCIAKYQREVAMARFNRWWSAQVPDLHPTAGYPEDAKRWLAQAGPPAERLGEVLVRRPGRG